MATPEERDDLVELARSLEVGAELDEADYEARLADFNARTKGECTRATFKLLDQSEEPEELVDRLLEIRDAPAFVPPTTRTELEAFLARADASGGASYIALDYAGRALAHLSQLPADLAHALGSGFGSFACWPPRAEIVDLALAYRPLTTRDELFAFLRRWLEDEEAGRESVYVAIGEPLLFERQRALALPELEVVVRRLESGVHAQRVAAMRRLRELVLGSS